MISSHPNIIEFYDWNTVQHNNQKEIFILLEYCEKGSLMDYMNQQKNLNEKEILDKFYQICLAVSHLHSIKPHPIIHRDLKVENILIDNNNTLKLCDFGSATCISVKLYTYYYLILLL